MSNSLQPHKLQHSRLLCPPLSPRVCSNSHPLHQWCYLTISASATPFSFCFQSFPASGSFPTSWLFASGGQSIRASASVFPINIQGWLFLGWTGLISLQSKGLSKLFSSPTVQKCIHTHTHIYTHTYIHNSVGPWTTWVWPSWVHIQIFFQYICIIILRDLQLVESMNVKLQIWRANCKVISEFSAVPGESLTPTFFKG